MTNPRDPYVFRFQVGDRVCRTEAVFFPDETEPRPVMLRGRVVRRYATLAFGSRTMPHNVRPYPELYVVQWDDGARQDGYLAHGLEPDL